MLRAPFYPNLTGEIAKKGICKDEIAAAIGVTPRTLRYKLNGSHEFSWPEVCIIQRDFFPGCSKDYLFATEETHD